MSQQHADASAVIHDVPPATVDAWIRAGEAILIDVREDFEHASEHIPSAEHVPLPKVDPAELARAHPGKRIVFQCRTGKRSHSAASRCASLGEHAFHLAGGIEAWKAAGLPVERAARAPRLDIMRQVQLVAGSLVGLGTLLAALVSPWFLMIPGFVACGLVFAGLSGWCGMAKLLAKMPWNRPSAIPSGPRQARAA